MFLNYHVCDRYYVTRCQDVMWLFHYLNLSSGEFMYLPVLLFSDVSLTLMRMAALIYLAWFCSSLPTVLILSTVVMWPVVLFIAMDGWGGLQVFFKSFLKSSIKFFNIFPLTVHPATLVSIYYTTFLKMVSLPLVETRRSLMVWPPLKCIWIPCLLQMFLQLSLSPLD